MTAKLHISNLSPTTTAKDLRGLFAEYGEISAIAMIQDMTTRRPVGAARILMKHEQDAQRCATSLNGTLFQGQVIHVTSNRQRTVISPTARTGGRSATAGTVADERRRSKDLLERLFTHHD